MRHMVKYRVERLAKIIIEQFTNIYVNTKNKNFPSIPLKNIF